MITKILMIIAAALVLGGIVIGILVKEFRKAIEKVEHEMDEPIYDKRYEDKS